MATKKIMINPDGTEDYTSLAEWEASMPNQLNSILEIHCKGCNKKVAELKEGNLIEMGCPRCKKKTVFAVQNIKRKD